MDIRKPIKDFEEYYEVSNDGHVYNKKTGKEICGDTNNAGYRRVNLYRTADGYHKRIFVHRLVAETFIDNPNNLPEVNHIDANKTNNAVSNLEWTDRISNQRNCIRQVRRKDYKPFTVVWDDGHEEAFEFNSELALRLGLTKRSIINWRQNKLHSYVKYGIKYIIG